jgi:hypothetical protein
MDEFVTLCLSRLDAGQIIDGLTERMKVWQATAEYLERGYSDISNYIEECSNPHEAHSIAEYYEKIIELIKKQLDNQKI